MQKEIKYNGYTATPSDYECPDGDLDAAVNMVPEDGALHPIMPPADLFTLPTGYTIAVIHKNSNYTHYIIRHEDNFYWVDNPNAGTIFTPADFSSSNLVYTVPADTDIYDVNTIGNTLIILSSVGMIYILWKEGDYNLLGSHLPEISIDFRNETADHCDEFDNNHFSYTLSGEVAMLKDQNGVDKTLNSVGGRESETWTVKDEYIDTISNAVIGALNKGTQTLLENGFFPHPFIIRYALRLYDGSITMHSAPIWMADEGFCRQGQPEHRRVYTVHSKWEEDSNNVRGIETYFTYCRLKLKIAAGNLADWSDIVQSVDFFVSPPIYRYKQSGKVTSVITESGTRDKDFNYPGYSEDEYNELVTNSSRFYHVLSVPVNEVNSDWIKPDLKGKLINLETRELMTDDYDSHDTIIPKMSYTYNQRINIADISKRYFHGFTPLQLGFRPADEGQATTYEMRIAVTLNVDGIELVYHAYSDGLYGDISYSSAITGGARKRTFIFFFPSIYATHVDIQYSQDNAFISKDLKRHDMLNGTYVLIRPSDYQYPSTEILPRVKDEAIPLPNRIFTSEVGNPFFFPVLGHNTVGTGTIIGIRSAAKALSQGQFGQFPLYAFTTEGVWALELSDSGSYKAIQPITRDVCINPESITQLDSSVLFATDRGIMMISGSNSICISDTLNAQYDLFDVLSLPGMRDIIIDDTMENALQYISFHDFLQQCRMIYDYTHQRVIVYNPTQSYAYIYSLKSKQWGMMPSAITGSLNSYPDALAEVAVNDGTAVAANNIVNFSQDAPDGITAIDGIIVTRPLKFDISDILKTIDTMIQRGRFTTGHVKTILYGSRDLFNWFTVYSSITHYLRGFRGTPYKYFRVVLICSLTKDESVYGCTVNLTPRLTNQIR